MGWVWVGGDVSWMDGEIVGWVSGDEELGGWWVGLMASDMSWMGGESVGWVSGDVSWVGGGWV